MGRRLLSGLGRDLIASATPTNSDFLENLRHLREKNAACGIDTEKEVQRGEDLFDR